MSTLFNTTSLGVIAGKADCGGGDGNETTRKKEANEAYFVKKETRSSKAGEKEAHKYKRRWIAQKLILVHAM